MNAKLVVQLFRESVVGRYWSVGGGSGAPVVRIEEINPDGHVVAKGKSVGGKHLPVEITEEDKLTQAVLNRHGKWTT